MAALIIWYFNSWTGLGLLSISDPRYFYFYTASINLYFALYRVSGICYCFRLFHWYCNIVFSCCLVEVKHFSLEVVFCVCYNYCVVSIANHVESSVFQTVPQVQRVAVISIKLNKNGLRLFPCLMPGVWIFLVIILFALITPMAFLWSLYIILTISDSTCLHFKMYITSFSWILSTTFVKSMRQA